MSMTEMTAGTVDKQALALRFGHAAQHYDRYARFQQDVGQHLLSLIPDGKHEVVLDLGCGTGFFLEKLQTGCRSLIAAGCWISKEGWRQEAGRVFGGSGRRARKQN